MTKYDFLDCSSSTMLFKIDVSLDFKNCLGILSVILIKSLRERSLNSDLYSLYHLLIHVRRVTTNSICFFYVIFTRQIFLLIY